MDLARARSFQYVHVRPTSPLAAMTLRSISSAAGYIVDVIRDTWRSICTPRWIHDLENEPEPVDPDADNPAPPQPQRLDPIVKDAWMTRATA